MPAPPDGPLVLLVATEVSLFVPFTRALRRAGIRTDVVPGAATARERLRSAAPSLVIVDVRPEAPEWAEACRDALACEAASVVAIVGRDDTGRVTLPEGVERIVRPFGFEQVAARVHRLLTGPARPPVGPVLVGDLLVDLERGRALLAGEPLQLARKELALLLRLAREAGRVVTRRDLMHSVWGEDRFQATHTLDVHVRRLRRKLGDDPAATRYVHTVRGVGFRLGEEAAEQRAAPRQPAGHAPPDRPS